MYVFWVDYFKAKKIFILYHILDTYWWSERGSYPSAKVQTAYSTAPPS